MNDSTSFGAMTAETTSKIVKDICEAIGRAGDECSQWQVGVTASLEHLFGNLGIPREPHSHICRRAVNAIEAQSIAQAFWNIECGKSPHSAGPLHKKAVYIFACRKHPSSPDGTPRRRVSTALEEINEG